MANKLKSSSLHSFWDKWEGGGGGGGCILSAGFCFLNSESSSIQVLNYSCNFSIYFSRFVVGVTTGDLSERNRLEFRHCNFVIKLPKSLLLFIWVGVLPGNSWLAPSSVQTTQCSYWREWGWFASFPHFSLFFISFVFLALSLFYPEILGNNNSLSLAPSSPLWQLGCQTLARLLLLMCTALQHTHTAHIVFSPAFCFFCFVQLICSAKKANVH